MESFELMVNQAREGCLENFRGLRSSKSDYPAIQDNLLLITFHHPNIAAKPIFEIFNATTAEILKDKGFRARNNVSDIEYNTFVGALSKISVECNKLFQKRNSLLHGTWFIDYLSGYDPNPMTGDFFVLKGNPNSSGWGLLDLPRKAEELNDLSARCENARSWIRAVTESMPFTHAEFKITDYFKFSDEKWDYVPSSR